MKIVRDIRALTDMVEDVDTTVSLQERRAAAKIVCSQFVDDERPMKDIVQDVADLMKMLGVHPSQDDEALMPTSLRGLRNVQ